MAKKGNNPSYIARMLIPALALGVTSGEVAAQNDEATAAPSCGTYTIARGDTLRKVARNKFGRDERDDWKLIYESNRDIIGRSPDLIEIGMNLRVPCIGAAAIPTADATAAEVPAPEADEPPQSQLVEVQSEPVQIGVVSVQTTVSAPSLSLQGNFQPAPADTPAPQTTVAAVPAPAPEAQPEPAPEPVLVIAEQTEISSAQTGTATMDDEARVMLVTGNGYAPFTDESLPGRGFFTLLVQTAMLRADPDRPYTIKFVNDWDAHLDALMPSLAFDGSFPWAQPDCSQMSLLSKAEQSRCVTYKFSDPFYEVVDGFFSRKGSGFEEAVSYSEFAGTVICRPEGYTTSHLDLAGLRAPLVRYVHPVDVATCFEMLMRADVDLVSIESQVADDTIAKLGLRDVVMQNPNLAALRPLTVIVHKDAEDGDALLTLLNEGLRIMRDSGEWYAITSRALMQQAEAES